MPRQGRRRPPTALMSTTAPNPDPRVGLHGGWFNAGEAIWNLDVVSKTPPSAQFTNPSTPGDRRLVNSDLAFLGNYVIQVQLQWRPDLEDISNPAEADASPAHGIRLPRLTE